MMLQLALLCVWLFVLRTADSGQPVGTCNCLLADSTFPRLDCRLLPDPDLQLPAAGGGEEGDACAYVEAVDISGSAATRLPEHAFARHRLVNPMFADTKIRVVDGNLDYVHDDAFSGSNIETNLEELDLSGNKLVKVPIAISKLRALRSLYIANNKISALPNFLPLLSISIADFNMNPIECKLAQYVDILDSMTLVYWTQQYTQCTCGLLLNVQDKNTLFLTYFNAVENSIFMSCDNAESYPASVRGSAITDLASRAAEIREACTADAGLTLAQCGSNDLDLSQWKPTPAPKCRCEMTSSNTYKVSCLNVTSYDEMDFSVCAPYALVEIEVKGKNVLENRMLKSEAFSMILLASDAQADTEISLQYLGLEEIHDSAFVGSNLETSLESLDLQHNRLRTVSSAIARLSSLRSLNLNDNLITAIPPQQLSAHPLLTFADFNNNNITCGYAQYVDRLSPIQLVYWPEFYITCTCDVIRGLFQPTPFKRVMTYFMDSTKTATFIKCNLDSHPKSVQGYNLYEIGERKDTVLADCDLDPGTEPAPCPSDLETTTFPLETTTVPSLANGTSTTPKKSLAPAPTSFGLRLEMKITFLWLAILISCTMCTL